MTLTYYGHCAFMWTSRTGIRVLIDPYGNSAQSFWFLRVFPQIQVDVVLVTHDHFDHNAIGVLPDTPSVLRGPGSFTLDDMVVRGIGDIHSGNSGQRGMQNTIFMVESEGVRYCHIGDNRHNIENEAMYDIGEVDVLMVTVDDSRHLLSYDQVNQLVERIDPKVVVPMHYYINGLTADSSTLETAERWLATQDTVKLLAINSLEIESEDLPSHREVWVFEPAEK